MRFLILIITILLSFNVAAQTTVTSITCNLNYQINILPQDSGFQEYTFKIYEAVADPEPPIRMIEMWFAVESTYRFFQLNQDDDYYYFEGAGISDENIIFMRRGTLNRRTLNMSFMDFSTDNEIIFNWNGPCEIVDDILPRL